MKKFVPLLFTLFAVSSMLADDYKILQMNTTSVRIGNRACKKGDVFSDDSIITWSETRQAIKAQNLKTKQIVLFAAPAFKAKKSKTVKDYYLKINHLSSRNFGLNDMGEQLNDTFYILDSLYIESPIPLDSMCSYIIQYKTKDERVTKKLYSKENEIILYRDLFEPINDTSEYIQSVFFHRDGIDEDFLLTDSMRVVLLPLVIEEDMSAQEIEPVDSLDEETGLIYHPDGTVSVDSLCTDTIGFKNPPVPQIPIGECDSLVVVDPMFHYCVVYKKGLCGAYDFKKKRNVTRIEFPYLEYAYRKEMEGQYYTYLTWKIADGRTGIVGISEQTNEFVTIIFPKEAEDD